MNTAPIKGDLVDGADLAWTVAFTARAENDEVLNSHFGNATCVPVGEPRPDPAAEPRSRG